MTVHPRDPLNADEIRQAAAIAVDRVSFRLKPSGLFDRNPALDVPPTH